MKKRIVCLISLLLCIFMCFSLSSCTLVIAASAFLFGTEDGEAQNYELEYPREYISFLGICYVESSDENYSVVKEIEDIDSFLTDFYEIGFKENYLGSFFNLKDEYAIYIEYINGDKEIIGCRVQKTVIVGTAEFEKQSCEKEDFNELINRYMNIL